MYFFVVELEEHAVELFLFFDDLFEPIDGLHLRMLLLLPVDHIYDGAFLSSIGVGHCVE